MQQSSSAKSPAAETPPATADKASDAVAGAGDLGSAWTPDPLSPSESVFKFKLTDTEGSIWPAEPQPLDTDQPEGQPSQDDRIDSTRPLMAAVPADEPAAPGDQWGGDDLAPVWSPSMFGVSSAHDAVAGFGAGSGGSGGSGGPGGPGGSGGGTPQLALEKTNIVVDAFPAIDSAGLYIAQMDGLFAAQGLHVTIVPTPAIPPSTQDLINGQEQGRYDITAGDYVTYIDNELGVTYNGDQIVLGVPKVKLRIIAEASFLQPNVLTLLVKNGSPINSVSQLKNRTVSVNAPDDIGTLLIDSLLIEHGVTPRQVRFANVPFPGVATALTTPGSPVSASFVPEPFVSLDEAGKGVEELADLDQGSTQDFPIQGYAVTEQWAQKYPNTLKAFTTALSQGQQIADTDRAAVEDAIEKYLGIQKEAAAFISLPTFPLGVDSVRLQRVVSAMSRFGLLPQETTFRIVSMVGG